MASESEKYEVLEKIGHGSFGIIHKVRRKSDNHVLCRKEISYSRMSQKEREQLQAELSILKELRHPNIVAYYERHHDKVSQDLHLYMEYCGNGDLGQLIKRLRKQNQYAEEEFVWSVFAQIVGALYRCHYGENPPEPGKAGDVMKLGLETAGTSGGKRKNDFTILHRDLKPENIFLDATNAVKLGDFGLSKILQSHDFASTYVGTPFYMSPEICAAEKYGTFSDIWSLGCIIYELCAREPPFNAKTHWDLIQKIKAGRYPTLPPVYSPELMNVVEMCLQVRPDSRPSASQLINLPIVKLMRKEQEVVLLGKTLKKEKEVADKAMKAASAKAEMLEKNMRHEIDASVRREWELKARLEIDRQVKMEIETLQTRFEAEVARRVGMEVDARMSAIGVATNNPTSNPPLLAPTTITTNPNTHPPRSSTPTHERGSTIIIHPDALKSSFPPSDFPSESDMSSISASADDDFAADSPLMAKKRASRTPFTRAKTMFAAANENNVQASPMDVTMADPSPISNSLAGLSLSPRRTASGERTQDFGAQGAIRMRPNIFGLAGEKLAPAADRWQPQNISDIPASPTLSEQEFENDLSDYDPEEERSPSRTRKTAPTTAPADPFKVLSNATHLPAAIKKPRPSLGRQKTMPVKPGRQASAPGIFSQQSKEANGTSTKDFAMGGYAKSRPVSAVPIIAASPTRRTGVPQSPSRKNLPSGSKAGDSPSKKPSATSTLVATLANVAQGGKSEGLKSKKGNEELRQIAARNTVQGRTLVELAQARAGGLVRDSAIGNDEKSAAVKVLAAPVWDPVVEGDAMPSPFLRKGTKVIR
ncbi:kinase-like protein [Aulographum hederae CBS 113979]|uniref:non-specific serine/threonine protein kinase n=1 Tax=Aulographum hederae CBS 113979 TaxID=1176131 RepID=A0A6G1H844_9PEZI|nr:kinase-like protein [Aulographum hederae CBS 113979]